jgi:DNA-binding Lrp family transcriptional regulator
MESKVFKIDEIDKNIIELIQKEPTLTHTEIAKRVNRSQPTIGMRIRKLEDSGVLKFQAGINVKTMDLILARVEIQTLKPLEIIDLVKKCPYMLNAFRLSGSSNISVFITSPKLEHLDRIINCHFRKNKNVLNVHMNVVTDVVNDFVLPFDFDYSKCEYSSDGFCCGKCITN